SSAEERRYGCLFAILMSVGVTRGSSIVRPPTVKRSNTGIGHTGTDPGTPPMRVPPLPGVAGSLIGSDTEPPAVGSSRHSEASGRPRQQQASPIVAIRASAIAATRPE